MGNLGSLDVLENAKVSSIRTGHGLPGRMVTALFEDHTGRIWVGIDEGLWMYNGKSFTPILKPDGTHLSLTFNITEDAKDDIWARAVGLFHIHGLKVIEEFPDDKFPVAQAIYPDPDGSIWLGYRNGSLGRLRNGQLQQYPAIPGMMGNTLGLLIGPDGWIWGIARTGLFAWREGKSVV